MSVVEVAVPVTRVKTRLTLFKGRPWSVVEHLILNALVKRPVRIADLATGFKLRRGIVEEALNKLTRASWVHLTVAADGNLLVEATPYGSVAAVQPVLPHTTRRVNRGRWLVFDQICGHVFGLGELDHFRSDDLGARVNPNGVVIAKARLFEGEYRRDELIQLSLEDDEQLINVEPTPEYATDRLALVQVVDGEVEGLPAREEFSELKAAILEAAETNTHRSSKRRGWRRRLRRASRPQRSKSHSIRFERGDLVVGGPAHRQAIKSALETAQSRVIIHSTFLSEDRFRDLLPLMIKAVRRNVAIDILWGQVRREDDARDNDRPTAEETAARLRNDPTVDAFRERLRIHTESTRSHMKVVIADPVRRAEFVALIGSCNWLASKFDKVEASVYVRHPSLVGEVLHALMRLVQAGSGIWPEFATDLHALSQRMTSTAPKSRANGKARLLIGEAHNTEILRARDTLRQTLLLTSNKLGRRFSAAALIPLARRCAGGNVDASILYSSLWGIDRPEASQFQQEAKTNGIHLVPKKDPRVHAKVLAWDDSHAIITSQNWLSADSGYTPLATELGVVIECPGAGAWVREAFAQCLSAPGSGRLRKRPRNRRFRGKSRR